MRAVGGLICVLVVLTAPLAAAPVQWSSDVGGNNHYYEFRSGPMDWLQAAAEAERASFLGKSGQLVSITSSTEDKFVFALIPSGIKSWIGLTDGEAYGGQESYDLVFPPVNPTAGFGFQENPLPIKTGPSTNPTTFRGQ